MSLFERIHNEYVYSRRVRVLSEQLAKLILQNARVLDIGCGDGLVAHLVTQKRPDLHLQGLDVLVRKQAQVTDMEINSDTAQATAWVWKFTKLHACPSLATMY